MAECQSSDGSELGSAFEQYREPIRRYVQRLTRSAADAQELTQETFLRAHRNLESLQDRAAFSAWLFRIATNVAVDWLRQKPRVTQQASDDEAGSAEELADTDSASLQTIVEQKEMSDCVQGYLEQLSDDYRAVIILHDIEGMTTPEIAELLGITVGAVKIRLHRARKKLEAALNAGCQFSHDRRGVLICEPQSASKPRPGST